MGHITFSFTDYFQYLIIIINLAEDKDHCVIREMARMRCLLCKLLIVFMAFNEIFRVMCLSRYILALNVSVFKVSKIRNKAFEIYEIFRIYLLFLIQNLKTMTVQIAIFIYFEYLGTT